MNEEAKEYAYEAHPIGCLGSDCGNACTNKFCNKDINNAFIAGANWQKQKSNWVTVADQDPDEFKNVLLSAGSLPSVFVGYFDGEDFVVGNTGQIVEYFRVMHWMEIPA